MILYILLSGHPPFNGANEIAITEKILQGHYKLSGNEWVNISSDAKKLIIVLLQMDPTKRPTANLAFNSKWISQYSKEETIEKPIFLDAFSQLKTFHVI